MVYSILFNRFSVGLALACLGAAMGTGIAVGDRAPAPGVETFRSTEAMTYALGSKRAVGFFERQDGKCRVTLMIAEAVDLDVARPISAARLDMSMLPGQSATLGSEEREAMMVTCGSGAWTVAVKRTSPARS